MITISQWDNIELSQTIENKQRIDEYNRQASNALPVNDQTVTSKTFKVVNRRTGTKSIKTLYQVNQERQEACIKKFWTRMPRSNSNSFVYHTVQNQTVTQD